MVAWVAKEQPTFRKVVHERGVDMAIAIVEQISKMAPVEERWS